MDHLRYPVAVSAVRNFRAFPIPAFSLIIGTHPRLVESLSQPPTHPIFPHINQSMYTDTADKFKIQRPVLPGYIRPWPKRHLEASTSSPRPLKRTKTAPSSKDGPHILHSYRLEHPPYEEDQTIDDNDDESESSSSESEELDSDPDSDARWEKEFLLGAPGTRGEKSQHNARGKDTEGKDTAADKSSLVQTNSQPDTTVDIVLEEWDEPSEDMQPYLVEHRPRWREL
ncbi:hypothetical protein IW261DRAFT_881432 [Armillaria novae-zelandiae]|uniref:Uncharacterized protein n=1 Tax=Armillaria novae-zelandiae TaxID=153914 RepID=A0AA39UFJ3_9AGAR|nr:hypothetical protein IW261DRAFT_881432 [Armillaria novae-zelandiae]